MKKLKRLWRKLKRLGKKLAKAARLVLRLWPKI